MVRDDSISAYFATPARVRPPAAPTFAFAPNPPLG